MVSVESVANDLAEAAGDIIRIMQQSDLDDEYGSEWADEMYDAYELVKKAIQSLARSAMYEPSS